MLSDHFKTLSTLGSGSFGTVYKVMRYEDKREYVVKAIRVKDLSSKEQLAAVNEVKLLAKIKSPYIVKYYDYYLDKEYLHIVMEFCNYGDLTRLIKKAKSKQDSESSSGLRVEIIWSVLLQIILGLYYLHSEKILHRDLKSANVFLNAKDDSFEVKIGDLGVAKLLDTSTAYAQTIVGTPYYLSPELCADQPYRDKTDCWALGVIAFECCCLHHPFDARHQAALIMKIIQSPVPALPRQTPSELSRLTMWLLEKDPASRASTRDLLNEACVRDKLNEYSLPLPETLLACEVTNRLNPAAYKRPPAHTNVATAFVAGVIGNRGRGSKVKQTSQKALQRYQVPVHSKESVSKIASRQSEAISSKDEYAKEDVSIGHPISVEDDSENDYDEDFELFEASEDKSGNDAFTMNVDSMGYEDSLGGDLSSFSRSLRGGDELPIISAYPSIDSPPKYSNVHDNNEAKACERKDIDDDAEMKEKAEYRQNPNLLAVAQLVREMRSRCEESLGPSLFGRLYNLCANHVTRPLHMQSERTIRNNEEVVKELGDLLQEQLLAGAEVAFDAVKKVKVLLAMESELDRITTAETEKNKI